MKNRVISDFFETYEYYKRHFINPKRCLLKKFKERMGYDLNLTCPVTYNEKIQWLKLYDRNPLYTQLVDKYEVKKYVSNLIGDEYIIPTFGVWNHFDDINFSKLPNQFVLKCTHDSGGIAICNDRKSFNFSRARKILQKSLRRNYYYYGFEWAYKNIKPRIIAEQYMEDEETEELRDYKFFCFDGSVKALFIATDRQKVGEDVKFDFFDSNFNHLPIKQGHENATHTPAKPFCFDEMKKIAEILSKGIKHVRVDLYEANKKVLFGEMTFCHHGGWTKFEPFEWDYTFGSWFKI